MVISTSVRRLHPELHGALLHACGAFTTRTGGTTACRFQSLYGKARQHVDAPRRGKLYVGVHTRYKLVVGVGDFDLGVHRAGFEIQSGLRTWRPCLGRVLRFRTVTARAPTLRDERPEPRFPVPESPAAEDRFEKGGIKPAHSGWLKYLQEAGPGVSVQLRNHAVKGSGDASVGK